MAQEDKITLVINGDRFGLYIGPTLALHDIGDTEQIAKVVSAVAHGRDAYAVLRDRPHLSPGGVWAPHVDDFSDPTPRQRILAEIANLRAEGERCGMDAGFTGRMDDGGARALFAQADAMQRALDLLAPSDV